MCAERQCTAQHLTATHEKVSELTEKIQESIFQRTAEICFSHSFLDGLRKYVDSIPPRDRYTELMAQVDRLEQHSTKFGQFRLVTAMQLKYRV